MQLLKVDDLETARKKLQVVLDPLIRRTITLESEESLGYVVAEDILCQTMIPQFRRSTVDGYAVIAKNTQGASDSIPVFLEMIEEIEIGTVPKHFIQDGQCAYVPTGGMIPDGTDAMVMVEYSEEFMAGQMALYKAVSEGSNVVAIGEDLAIGEVVVPRGSKIRGQEIGAMVAAGVSHVEVYQPLRVAIISTGDELVGPADVLPMGKVKDVNTYALAGLAKQLGMEIVSKQLVLDEETAIRDALETSANLADLILISGGSSKGKKDMTEQLIDEVSGNGVFTHGLALKPGKPTIIGWGAKTETLFLGLPGHPVAAMMVFRLLLEWVQCKGYGSKLPYPVRATMETNLAGAPGRETCILVELLEEKDVQLQAFVARPILGKSGLISNLSRAYGYVKLEKNTEGIQAGTIVNVWPV